MTFEHDPRQYARSMQLMHKYNLTIKAFNRMVDDQHNRCAICDETFTHTPHVDHNHKTGKVRGLLCTRCNTGLGFFRDRIRLLAAAIVYLEANGHEY